MEINKNQALTPNKKQDLLDMMQGELDATTQELEQNNNFGTITLAIINKARTDLQQTINKFLEKKGVITPSETSDAIEKMNALKKARLQQEYVLGLKKGTWFIIGFLALGVGAYIYYKKRAK